MKRKVTPGLLGVDCPPPALRSSFEHASGEATKPTPFGRQSPIGRMVVLQLLFHCAADNISLLTRIHTVQVHLAQIGALFALDLASILPVAKLNSTDDLVASTQFEASNVASHATGT
jgi:hypothetical protein